MPRWTGAQKAAIILLSLGEDTCADVLRNLTTEEIRRVGLEMSAIQVVKRDVSQEIVQEFTARFHEEDDISAAGDQVLKNLLPGVLGASEAKDVLSGIEKEKEEIPFKHVREMDARILANFIRGEHPQTISIIVAHLGHAKASQVLSHLPSTLQYEVVHRIAHLETVPQDLVREVDEVLERELLSVGKTAHQVLGGVQTVAEILNQCDRRTGDGILASLEEGNADLAERVRKLMFVFEDLAGLDDMGMRELLKECANDVLLLALKTASDDLKTKIFRNMSQRASQMLQEDLSSMGPVRLSDVEAAQQQILTAARNLEKQGKIVLAGGEGKDAVI